MLICKTFFTRYLATLCGLLYCALAVIPATPCTAQATEAASHLEFAFDPDASVITEIKDTGRDIDWLAQPSPLFDLGPESMLIPRLNIERLSDSEVELTLTLHNPTDQPIKTDIQFPVMSGIAGQGEAGDLAYGFPRQDLILGSEPIDLNESYSSRFPLQFLTAYRPGEGGVFLLTCDTQMHRKQYFLRKKDDITMGVSYPDITVQPGETRALPAARIGVCEGDWHGGFDAYRRWVATWYQPVVERKDWFRSVFNFRQVFLRPNLDTPGLYNPGTASFGLVNAIENDIEQFGGVDYAHVFDWSQTADQGRVGAYDPWHYLPRDRFTDSLAVLQKRDIPVGLYFEGYLASPAAAIPGLIEGDWLLRARGGGRYARFGSGYHYLCPGVSPWQNYFSLAVNRTAEQVSADGYYIDQFGFGYQYPCFNPDHGHAIPSNQVRLETELIQQLRKDLPAERILYTEQVPVDVAMQYQDGSFSYSLLHARHAQCPSRTNLTRFAFPDFKTIQILRGDGPIGDDVAGVKLVFFNGDGLWLVGPNDQAKWYSEAVLAVIRKTYKLKRQYADAFTSDLIYPLVPTLVQGVYANRFEGEGKIVWTLYNAADEVADGALIKIKHIEGAEYVDAWNGVELNTTVEAGWATIKSTLAPGDVGCIVQTLDHPEAREK